MAGNANKKPSEVELQILSLLWERGPMTAREVLESMPDGKDRAYTSILSVMQVMEKKKFLKKKREGMTHRWSPVLGKDQTLGQLLGDMVAKVFGGSPSAVMQQLMQSPSMTLDELREIKRLLGEARKSRTQTPDENAR